MTNDYDVTGRNVGVNAIAAACTRIALHTGDPGGVNGSANEVAGGSPAYVRKPIGWGPAAGGAAHASADVVLDVPDGVTVTYVSLWNAGGTIRYLKKPVADATFGAQGTYTIVAASTTLDLNDP